MKQAGTYTTSVMFAPKRYNWNSHPKGFACCGGSVVGKWVEADIDAPVKSKKLALSRKWWQEDNTIGCDTQIHEFGNK